MDGLMENPFEMDDLGVPVFSETSKSCNIILVIQNHDLQIIL